jgi:hypothetical protein
MSGFPGIEVSCTLLVDEAGSGARGRRVATGTGKAADIQPESIALGEAAACKSNGKSKTNITLLVGRQS